MMKRQKWTEEENGALRDVVSNVSQNPIHWEEVSSLLARDGVAKTSKQCRERWLNHLSPRLVKSQWTLSENMKLLELHRRMKNRWKQITKNFKGRTDNSIKNQFFSLVRKGLRKASKIVQRASNTKEINKIKPKVLSKVMNQNLTLPVHLQIKNRQKHRWVNEGAVDLTEFIYTFSISSNLHTEISEYDQMIIEFILDWIKSLKFAYQHLLHLRARAP